MRAATNALPALYKAHKWFLTRDDLDYTALWILYTATPLAQMEVIAAGLLADREVIPQAIALNPNLAVAWYVRGWLSIFQGNAASALSDLDHARRLSPYDRLVFKINAAMAYAHFFAGRYDDAGHWRIAGR